MTVTAPTDLELPAWLQELSDEELRRLVEELPASLKPVIAARLQALQRQRQPWEPYDYQQLPADDGTWDGFLMLGGRGAGKTAAVTHLMNEHAEGPPCIPFGRAPHRMGIIAPTHGDAFASIIEGDDGLTAINPHLRITSRGGYTTVNWPNGAFAYVFGAHTKNDIDRLRPRTNRCFDLFEELAALRYLKDGYEQAEFGRRTLEGMARPKWVAATTPKPRPTLRKLVADPRVRVVTATTADNVRLNQAVRDALYERYANTRLGLQELEGKILEEISGAIWHQELIEQHRVTWDEVPTIARVRTAVDPSWGTTNDECGIIVGGKGVNGHVYIFEDLSKRTTPSEWGTLAALGYLPARAGCEHDCPEDHEHEDARWRDWRGEWHDEAAEVEPKEWAGRRSEYTLAEKNFQGEQVRLVMKLTSRELDRRLPFHLVNASQGKRLRAEPVHLSYENGKVHHVGRLEGLEWQMTNWVPPEASEEGDDEGDPPPPDPDAEAQEIDPSKWSPDRLDAMVFLVTDLLLSPSASTGKIEVADGRLPKPTGKQGAKSAGKRIGGFEAATRQGRLAAAQLKGRRTGPGQPR